MRYFSTCCDSNYMVRFLPMYRSLVRHSPSPIVLFVLCLDRLLLSQLQGMRLPGVVPIGLTELEREDGSLLKVKADRTASEYYFTCSASWFLYLFNAYPEVERITYLDADVYFYSSIEPVFEEIGTSSIAIVPHRFAARFQDGLMHGRYNKGCIHIARGPEGLRCLNWWRERCLDWCYDRVEDGKFADQRYLDDFPTLFSGVHVCEHKGADVGPWNVERYCVSRNHGRVLVDADPLIFYHFVGYRQEFRRLIDPGIRFREWPLPRHVLDAIHKPYVKEILECRKLLERLVPGFQDLPGNTRGSQSMGLAKASPQYIVRSVMTGEFFLCLWGKAWYSPVPFANRFFHRYDRTRVRSRK